MKVYLIHLKTLKDRRKRVIDLLCECEMISEIELIMTEQSDLKFATIEEILDTLPEDFPRKLMTKGAASLCHKQYTAFKKIAECGEPAIILEDDVLFNPAQFDQFIQQYNEIPSDWECCFFGTGCNLKLDGTGFIKNDNRLKTKCTDSFVMHPQLAKVLYDQMSSDKVYTAIDWDLNYRFLTMNTNVYWYEPGITVQGSLTGIYESLC